MTSKKALKVFYNFLWVCWLALLKVACEWNCEEIASQRHENENEDLDEDMDGCEKVKKAKMVFISFQDFQVEQSEKPEPTIPHYSIAISISFLFVFLFLFVDLFYHFLHSFSHLTRLILLIWVSVFQSFCRLMCLFRYFLTISLRLSVFLYYYYFPIFFLCITCSRT
jgi:hypothetical protein